MSLYADLQAFLKRHLNPSTPTPSTGPPRFKRRHWTGLGIRKS